jgi:hypothetical protein
MTAPPRLVLKQSTGWFAAGWGFSEAMLMLSDAGFKLFAWLCVNADRHTGQVAMRVDQIARVLNRAEGWTQAALEELVERGVCTASAGVIEISDTYWPYEKQAVGSGPRDYVAQVRKILSTPACVRCRFPSADERMALELYRRGVTLPQIARAIWLGCARKYNSMLANGGAFLPIASLSYFASVIDEVCQTSAPDSYWAYIQRQAGQLETEWLSRTGGLAQPSA